MAREVNKVKNADFSLGKAEPAGWTFSRTGQTATWQRGQDESDSVPAGIVIDAEDAPATARFTQTLVCRPGTDYRVEATVSCRLEADNDTAGCILTIQPLVEGRPHGDPRSTPGLHVSPEAVAVRTYYRAPQMVRRVHLSVGLVSARGRARIHHVRFIEMLEPDLDSRNLAVPPPGYALRPIGAPERTRVAVCSTTAGQRPVTQLLRLYFGQGAVRILEPETLSPSGPACDAILLPDPTPPKAIRSLRALVELARRRIVVISLPAFATLTRGLVRLRRIEQPDDPIHAKVALGCHATQGFALEDTFPYAWPGRRPTHFVQNQYYRSAELKEFCRKNGFRPLLLSMCDKETTSDRPISLFKETPQGALVVLDIEPAEAPASTFGEPVLAANLLLAILGWTISGLGQFAVPYRTEADFRGALRELAIRLAPMAVHDADVPAEEVTEQLVTVGRDYETFGLPITPKPVILVRSGLSAGDMESVYGALVWFKQLLRMPPYTCPYAGRLASRFRLAWIPCATRWDTSEGWRGSDAPPRGTTADSAWESREKSSAHPRIAPLSASSAALRAAARDPEAPASSPLIQIDAGEAGFAALIDIVARPINRTRVLLPSLDGEYERYARWLPLLATTFLAGRGLTLAPDRGMPFTDRSTLRWRRCEHELEVVAAPDVFTDSAHRAARDGGGQLIRIEIPGSSADFTCHSIQRTDLAASLLEFAIGMQLGLVAVNRQDRPVQFDALPPVNPGEALIVEKHDATLDAASWRAG